MALRGKAGPNNVHRAATAEARNGASIMGYQYRRLARGVRRPAMGGEGAVAPKDGHAAAAARGGGGSGGVTGDGARFEAARAARPLSARRCGARAAVPRAVQRALAMGACAVISCLCFGRSNVLPYVIDRAANAPKWLLCGLDLTPCRAYTCCRVFPRFYLGFAWLNASAAMSWARSQNPGKRIRRTGRRNLRRFLVAHSLTPVTLRSNPNARLRHPASPTKTARWSACAPPRRGVRARRAARAPPLRRCRCSTLRGAGVAWFARTRRWRRCYDARRRWRRLTRGERVRVLLAGRREVSSVGHIRRWQTPKGHTAGDGLVRRPHSLSLVVFLRFLVRARALEIRASNGIGATGGVHWTEGSACCCCRDCRS